MYRKYEKDQFEIYREARSHFIEHPLQLIALEAWVMDVLAEGIGSSIGKIAREYNEASYLHPFWKNYPPDDRGRAPRGDQYPWIEVGEHAVGSRVVRLFDKYSPRDLGLPAGSDLRVVVTASEIEDLTGGMSDTAWLFLDIKSVGPRDDSGHAVMSPNQVSGNGEWKKPQDGLRNRVMKATGQRSSHDFHPAVPPIYILSDGTIVPVVLGMVKPVYRMLFLTDQKRRGQPLGEITIAIMPNGLLLEENPGYLKMHPGLLYPGKDDKDKNPLKLRARLSMDVLQEIDPWRVHKVIAPPPPP